MIDFMSRRVQYLIGVVLLLFAIGSLIGSWKTSHDLTDYVKCQQEWNSFLYVSISRSRGAGVEANQALDDLVDAVTQAKSAAETRAALERYKAARAKQKETAATNPLPPPPEEVCKV